MINIPVRTVTQLAAESVLSAAGRDMISRAVHAPYAAPVAVAIHAVAPALLIPRPPASSRIGLRDCLVLDELLMAETSPRPTSAFARAVESSYLFKPE